MKKSSRAGAIKLPLRSSISRFDTGRLRQLAVFAGILVLVFLPTNPQLWLEQALTGVIIASLALAVAIYYQTGSALVAAAGAYFLVRAAAGWAGESPRPIWGIVLASHSFGFFTLAIGGALVLRAQDRSAAFYALAGAAVACALELIAKRLSGGLVYSFMNNAAADGSMLAVMLPLVMMRGESLFKWKGGWPYVAASAITIFGILFSGSSTALAALVVAIAAGTACIWRRAHLPMIAAGTAILSVIGVLFMKESLLNDNGRFQIWRLSLEYFFNPEKGINPIFGAGSGSYFVLGPTIQLNFGYSPKLVFLFMHNDFLQVLFEQGYIGILLALAVGVNALRKSFDRPWLFAALCTYGTIMATQYPLRYFASALIGALLLSEAYGCNQKGGLEKSR